MNLPAISVIVPVYNVAPYLTQCVDSVMAQTFEDFELLLIDDGSTDASSAICDSYAARDDRVRVVHQPNAGLSAARNAGLNLALGEFISFLDGDDWFDTATLEVAHQTALNSGADLVLWPYVREYERLSLPKRLFEFDHRRFDSEETRHLICRRMVGLVGKELGTPENADALVTAWGKLYRRDLVVRSGATFTDTAVIGTEDALFNLQVLTHADEACYIDRFLSHYRRDNETSLTTRHKSLLPRQWTHLHALMRTHIADNSLGPDFEEALRNRISLSIIGIGLNALASPFTAQRIVREIHDWLSTPEYREAVTALELRHLPIHWLLFFAAAKHGNATLVFLLLKSISALRKWRNHFAGRSANGKNEGA